METQHAAPLLPPRPLRFLLVNMCALFGTLGFVAIMVVSLENLTKKSPEKADQTKCNYDMRQIGLALFEYQEKFGGKYPQDIMELESSGMIQNLAMLMTTRSGKGPWTYFPDRLVIAEPLLVSPEIGQKKMILYPDMTVRLKPVAEAEAEIHSSSTPGVKFWTPRKAPVSK